MPSIYEQIKLQLHSLSRRMKLLKPYDTYVATLSQTSTNAPVATVLENTIGDIVWSRSNVGDYRATLAGAFTSGKTLMFINNNSAINTTYYGIMWWNVDAIKVATSTEGLNLDGLLNKTSVEIRVYH